jgi:hypothetical protein
MTTKDFEKAMNWLKFGDLPGFYGEYVLATLEGIDSVIMGETSYSEKINPSLTPEQETTLKNRLLECKKYMTAGECLRWIKRNRKYEKIPKSWFWWWLDEL